MTYTVLCSYGPEKHQYKLIEYTSNKMPNEVKREVHLENYRWDNYSQLKIEIIGVN